MNAISSRDHLQFEIAKSVDAIRAQISDPRMSFLQDALIGLVTDQSVRPDQFEGMRAKMENAMVPANAIAKALRSNKNGSGTYTNIRSREFPKPSELVKSGAISKAQLDVGTLTNFASITGGQSLGYVSLDTQMARGTVRPNSFTLYQCLHKSGAYQVVDYWPYASDTGGGLPGSAFTSFGSVASGTLTTSAGVYNLNNITLKLAVNGRAITTALAAQNSFVDVTAQENINAALTVLQSMNWACYYGNSGIFPNQFPGIAAQIPAQNIFDWNAFNNSVGQTESWSGAQSLFNLIYEAAAQITSYRQFGRITHAFMSPTVAGSLQSLVTTVLNNIVTVITPSQERLSGIVVDGDLQGMRTRFGEIQFPIDLFIDSRNRAAQAIYNDTGGNFATTSSPAPVTSVTVTALAASAIPSGSVSLWSSPYAGGAGSGIYTYAAAALDGAMNESQLRWGLGASGVVAGGAYNVAIAPSEATDVAFRVYRSGLGYAPASSGVANPAAVRYIGTIAASAGSTVNFVDLNAKIPGSEDIFLLDMDEDDYAIDFRYLLPLTKIELFAQNLYMPWAVAMIGAIRLRIPKFHGMIVNYVPDQPAWNPLSANANVT
jgi:hypothetical protein